MTPKKLAQLFLSSVINDRIDPNYLKVTDGLVEADDRIMATIFLIAGKSVRTPVRGPSMQPMLMNGSMVTVNPVLPKDIKIGDAIFAIIGGGLCIHFVNDIAVSAQGIYLFETIDATGNIDGWCSEVYGKAEMPIETKK